VQRVHSLGAYWSAQESFLATQILKSNQLNLAFVGRSAGWVVEPIELLDSDRLEKLVEVLASDQLAQLLLARHPFHQTKSGKT
jgi:hypothetical protein